MSTAKIPVKREKKHPCSYHTVIQFYAHNNKGFFITTDNSLVFPLYLSAFLSFPSQSVMLDFLIYIEYLYFSSS